ncbi:MAG: hypothetical protein V4514_11635 [Pseudomonadota bacterium]|uniref:hypothetical protein n=1 Tax=Phenylobacterium sp. TaxID=1871053 RepID=UPI0025F069E2|nr:hypothetical protein [Phenylobacterium sp.]MBT9471352.1 hypothetical protein [Phenylobacterium sp.]
MGQYTLFLLAVPIVVLVAYNIYAVRKHHVREREAARQAARASGRRGVRNG